MFAVPSIYVRETLRLANQFVKDGQIVVDVAKGIEAETLMTLTEVIWDELEADISIVALASGISAGLGYGDNAKSALITRGLAEITRLGEKMGCVRETFAELAGMGDLIVPATNMHSRNNRCGYLIDQGYENADAFKRVGMVVEGINAISVAVSLAAKYDVDMPIVRAVDSIINHGADSKDVVYRLMVRAKTSEMNS